MATSLIDKAARRAEEYEGAIREALAAGNTNEAVTEAVRALRSELAKLRDRRPAHGAVTDAEFAGMLLGIAAQLHAYKPRGLPGYPGIPRPADLLSVFALALERARQTGDSHG